MVFYLHYWSAHIQTGTHTYVCIHAKYTSVAMLLSWQYLHSNKQYSYAGRYSACHRDSESGSADWDQSWIETHNLIFYAAIKWSNIDNQLLTSGSSNLLE